MVKATIKKLVLHVDEDGSSISVEISGTARSVKRDGQELIESIVSRLLSKPSYKTGLAGFAVVFVIFAAGVFVKRSFDVLAEIWLPKDK